MYEIVYGIVYKLVDILANGLRPPISISLESLMASSCSTSRAPRAYKINTPAFFARSLSPCKSLSLSKNALSVRS